MNVCPVLPSCCTVVFERKVRCNRTLCMGCTLAWDVPPCPACMSACPPAQWSFPACLLHAPPMVLMLHGHVCDCVQLVGRLRAQYSKLDTSQRQNYDQTNDMISAERTTASHQETQDINRTFSRLSNAPVPDATSSMPRAPAALHARHLGPFVPHLNLSLLPPHDPLAMIP